MSNVIQSAEFFGEHLSIIDHKGRKWLTAESVGKGLGSQLSERMTTRYGATVEGIWVTQQIKEQMAINILKLAEDGCIAIPPDSYLASQLHAVKKIGKQRGISYQAERDDLGHGDVFWAHALALHKAAGMSGQFGAVIV